MAGETIGVSRRAVLGIGTAIAAIGGAPALALGPHKAARSTVGADGVWRWADGREVALFGVNYNLPSAAAFRFAKASGVPFEHIVEQDFAHFRRLGFDALRLSFWGDWESSTADGHVIDNEHLAVLDLIVARADAAGMSCLLSPIVTYDASWPDALDRPRAGISSAFDKDKLGIDGAAISAQARYLGEVLARTNPRTGRRYADEPAIVAVEPINEPTHHAQDRAGSVRYIDALAKAVRDAGFDRPIFYNVTQDMAIAPAIADADVQGATFAWYPTGLQTGHAVSGNGLLLVDDYPQFHDPALKTRAKLVYEFDAADSMATYFYPAMVREFRSGGAQFAAMFAYDALAIAANNSEFNDHFLNLAYTPGKAISALIAAAAMRDLPRGEEYGAYPADMRFGAFRVDDRADLSELVDATRFYHSNTTETRPPNPVTLAHLAGYGSSPTVTYDGTGAWFLDKVAPGVWHLEVYPDAALVDNPFVFRRPGHGVVRIVHRARRLALRLPDLGDAFLVAAADGAVAGHARSGVIDVTPGVYRLSRGATAVAIDPTYFAPPGERFAPIVQHVPPVSVAAERSWSLSLTVIGPDAPKGVTVQVRTDSGFVALALQPGHGFEYHGTVPPELLKPGYLDYYIVVETGGDALVSPSDGGSRPGEWDFPKRGGYRVPVMPADAPLILFDAARDGDGLIVPYGGYSTFAGISVVPGTDGDTAVRFDGRALKAAAHGDLSAQLSWNKTLDAQGRDLDRLTNIVVTGRSLGPSPATLTVILIERDGMAWGAPAPLGTAGSAVRVSLAAFKPVAAAMLPRDFPVGINPYSLRKPAGRGGSRDHPVLRDLQAVQMCLAKRFGSDERSMIEVTRIALKT